jgi:hypothetical protein
MRNCWICFTISLPAKVIIISFGQCSLLDSSLLTPDIKKKKKKKKKKRKKIFKKKKKKKKKKSGGGERKKKFI